MTQHGSVVMMSVTYVECHFLSFILCHVMLNVIRQGVVMTNVVAPLFQPNLMRIAYPCGVCLKAPSMGRLLSDSQTLDRAGNACQGQRP
jgi:hypothetical protein